MMKIGLFGGTFDPPHVGHLIVAEHVREHLGLGSMLFIPAAVAPHKQVRGVTDPRHRLGMVRAAIRENRHFGVSTLEIDRGGVSYTVETLRRLRESHSGDDLFLLLGTDMLSDFRSWRDPEEILSLAEVVALLRPDYPMPPLEGSWKRRITPCRIPQLDISSSDVRRRVREGKSIRFMVPPEVEAYIREHGLYRS